MSRKNKKDYYLKNSLKNNFMKGIFVLGFAMFWVWFVTNRLEYKQEFLKNANKTTAIITNIEYKSKINDDEIESVYIKYYVNGNEYNGKLDERSNNMYVGKEIDIFYNINNPNDFIQNNKVSNVIFKYFGYLFMIVGIWQLIYSINKYLLYISTLNCSEIKAKVESIVERNWLNYISYVIKCSWIDLKGEKHIFYSKSYNEPYFENEFNKMGIEELPVRFKNKKRYIVITEKIDKRLMK